MDPSKDKNAVAKRSTFFRKQKKPDSSKKDGKKDEMSDSATSEVNSENIDELFEKLLEDMNIPQDKRPGLRSKPLEVKIQMIGNVKTTNTKSVSDYIEMLRQIETDKSLTEERISEYLDSLRISLKNSPVSTVKEFNNEKHNGLNNLIRVLTILIDHTENSVMCLKCLRAFGNCGYGLFRLMENKNALLYIAVCLRPSKPALMAIAVEILTILSFFSFEGHTNVMEALFGAAKINGYDNRFLPLIEGVKSTSTHEDDRGQEEQDSLGITCIRFINVLVNPQFRNGDVTFLELPYRLHLRREFIVNGLLQVYYSLQRDNKRIETHESINQFFDDCEAEDEELNEKNENVIRSFGSSQDLFRIIYQTTAKTECEKYFCSILGSLMIIRDDPLKAQTYYFIDRLIAEIILQKDDDFCPDPSLRQFTEIKLSKFIESGSCESEIMSLKNELDDQKLKYDELMMKYNIAKEGSKQNKDAKTDSSVTKLKEQLDKQGLDGGIKTANKVKEHFSDSNMSHPKSSTTSPSKVPINPIPSSPSPGPQSNANVPPPPGPPPPSGAPLPPGPPPPSGAPLPPGPPPPPGGAPRPPGPPPPPGVSQPPAPPGFSAAAKPPSVLDKYGIKRNEFKPQLAMKKANWNKVNERIINENSVWIKIKEDTIPDTIFKQLEDSFAAKVVAEKPDVKDLSKPAKKVKELKVLDGKTAQNISILLGSLRMDYEKLKMAILEVDMTVLTASMIEQLIKNLPEGEMMQQLSELESSYSDLTEAEQFCFKLSIIKKLKPRLESILFQLKFEEKISDIKKQYYDAEKAVSEITKSEKLKKILELVLSVGNYMNSGSRNQQSIGFEVSFLTKLKDTKDKANKLSLIHFLADVVAQNYFDPEEFSRDFETIDKVKGFSLDNVNANFADVKKELKNLESMLKTFKPSHESDKFFDRMISFMEIVNEQISVCEAFQSKLTVTFKLASDYLCLNEKSYKIEDLFGDLYKFKEDFVVAHRQNVERKILEEKAIKAKAEKERREKEKEMKATNVSKKTSEDDGGVMDSLWEALKCGEAYGTNTTRKKRAPRNADGKRALNRTRSRAEYEDFSETLTTANMISIAS